MTQVTNTTHRLVLAIALVMASLVSSPVISQETLTPEQQELFDALQAEIGPQSTLQEAVEAYRETHETFLSGYEIGERQLAIDGIPTDGLTHSIRVAHDVFVLRGGDQVFGYREILMCDAQGTETGIPVLDCPDS